jgi:glycosyltransferase involved in cell wall biosynthesis
LEKLVFSRQGVDIELARQVAEALATRSRRKNQKFQLLYLGRWHPVKGIHTLVQAVQLVPKDIPLRLSIHAIGQGFEERDYAMKVCRMCQGDPRIVIRPPIRRENLARTLSKADALAVPSLWLETGPLVVLEARAAGLPIIGSRLGGIAELVREPEMGMLVPPGDPEALAEAIAGMALHPKARARASTVRTMRDVADEMVALYQSLLPRRI